MESKFIYNNKLEKRMDPYIDVEKKILDKAKGDLYAQKNSLEIVLQELKNNMDFCRGDLHYDYALLKDVGMIVNIYPQTQRTTSILSLKIPDEAKNVYFENSSDLLGFEYKKFKFRIWVKWAVEK